MNLSLLKFAFKKWSLQENIKSIYLKAKMANYEWIIKYKFYYPKLNFSKMIEDKTLNKINECITYR